MAAHTTPLIPTAQAEATASVSAPDKDRLPPYVDLWREVPAGGQWALVLAACMALVIAALRADRIIAAWRGGGKPEGTPQDPVDRHADPPPAAGIPDVLAELHQVTRQLGDLRAQLAAVPAVVAAQVERSEERTGRRLDGVSAGLTRVHERVDALHSEKADADRLLALERRMDRLSAP